MSIQPPTDPRDPGRHPQAETRDLTFRQSLYVMTVLVPVVATLGFGAGELTRRALAAFDEAPTPAPQPPPELASSWQVLQVTPTPTQRRPGRTASWLVGDTIPAPQPLPTPRRTVHATANWLNGAVHTPPSSVVPPPAPRRTAQATANWLSGAAHAPPSSVPPPAPRRTAQATVNWPIGTAPAPKPAWAQAAWTTAGRLNVSDRERSTSMQVSVVTRTPAVVEMLIRQADFWQSHGQPGKALESLSRVLAINSRDPETLARIEAIRRTGSPPLGAFDRRAAVPKPTPVLAASEPSRTLALSEAVLNRQPANMSVRHAAISAALKLNDRQRAGQLVQDGLRRAPNDPEAWLAASELDQALGQDDRAVQHLERARSLRQQQIGYASLSPAAASAQADPTRKLTVPGASTVVSMALIDDQSEDSSDDVSSPRTSSGPTLLFQGRATPAHPTAAVASRTRPSGQPVPSMPEPNQPLVGDTAIVNPFRDKDAAGVRTADSALVIGPRVPDPMLASIDHDLAELSDRTAPTVQAGLDFRNRSGEAGTSRLTQYSTPLETSFSPWGVGRVRLAAVPTTLDASRIDGSSAYKYANFGSAGLALQGSGSSIAYDGTAISAQRATGVGLDLGYELNNVKADVGTSPPGFPVTSALGGVEWAPQLSDNWRLRLTAERRAVDDSLLSYAGTRDSNSGRVWGGVTRTGGRAQLEVSAGKLDMYAAAGGAMLSGTHVEQNTMLTLQAGVSFPIWRTSDKEVRSGLNATYFEYAKNLSHFTLGQGGYFSPQSYISAVIPVTYQQKFNDNLSYLIGAGIGAQSYHQSAADYFPLDPSMQASWATKAATITGMTAQYPSSKQTGVAGSARAELNYNVTPSLSLSARFTYQHVGQYNETTGMVLAKYIFNGAIL